MPRNFVAEGAASNVIALADFAGIGLEPTQRDLTPLQRMVLQKEAKRQMDEAQRESGGGPGAGQQIPNSHYQPGGGSISGETVTYVNSSTE